jgi:Flp pilus assembly protein TadB
MANQPEKRITKAMQARRKDEQKVVKTVKKQLKTEAKDKAKEKDKKAAAKKKPTQTGTIAAARQFQKAGNNIFGLPPILWPFILIVAYQFARNSLGKEQQKRDMEEAKRFLHKSRGFR